MKIKIPALLILLVFLFSCSKTENNGSKSVFRMCLHTSLPSLDPASARDLNMIWMTSQIFNGLIELDDSLNVIPIIAKKWSISKDGLTYQFILRNDVNFHNSEYFGTKKTRNVVASDFVYSFTRICNPKTASSGQWIFNDRIEGIEKFQKNEIDTISGFKALNDTTLVIKLKKAFPPFLSMLAMPYGHVVPKEVVEKLGKDFRKNPIGTGPFRMKSWKENQYLILLKNENYFEKELPKLDAVHIRFIPSKLTAFAEFKKGNLDFLNDLDAMFKDEIVDENGLKSEWKSKAHLVTGPQLTTEYLVFNIKNDQNHPLKNPKVRKAINYAIDRNSLVKYIRKGIGKPANRGFIPLGLAGNDSLVNGYDFNPEKAKQLLAEAGYPEGLGLPVLTILSNPNYFKLVTFLQKSVAEIGIQMEVELLEGASLRERVQKGQALFWRASWIADYPDGENYLALFYSKNEVPNGPNISHFSNPKFDKLYENSFLETNPEKRKQMYIEMENIVLNESPCVYLFYDEIARLVSNDIQGFTTNPMNNLNLKNISKQNTFQPNQK